MAPFWVASLVLIGGTLPAAEAAPPRETPAAPTSGQPGQSPPAAATGKNGPPRDARPLRSGRELLDAVREALPRLAAPSDDRAEEAAEEFLLLYNELQRDTAMAAVHRDYYKAKVRCRLQTLSDQISKRVARDKRLATQPAPEQIRAGGEVGDQLAQRLARRGPATAPRPLPSGARPRSAMPSDDYGPQLVELIQKTIAPSSWDVNGGLGAIYYWRPGRALVIRQTDAVHEEVGDALRQLERASR